MSLRAGDGRAGLALALVLSLAVHGALLLLLSPGGGAEARVPRASELTLVPFGLTSPAGPAAGAAGPSLPGPARPGGPPRAAPGGAPSPAATPALAPEAAGGAGAAAAPAEEAAAAPPGAAPGEAPAGAGPPGPAGGSGAAGGPPGSPDGVAAAGPGPSAAEARLLAAVHARLLRAAERCQHRRGMRGVVQVRFTVAAGGAVEAVEVLVPSGSPLLDEAATGCVVPTAAPFPAEAAGRAFEVPVRF